MSEQANELNNSAADPADISQFLVHSAREIRFLLRQLITKKSLVAVFPDEEQHPALLSLLEVDESTGLLTLDVAVESHFNARLLKAQTVRCETQLDRVQIRFQLSGPMRSVQFQRGPALSVALPSEVLRLQRRDSYRIVTPISHPVRCLVPIPQGEDEEPKIFPARVLDISSGGLALAAPANAHEFVIGAQFDGCELEIPDGLPILTNLSIRNVFRITQTNGIELLRAGCQFVGLTRAQDSAVQRYILRLERERAARA